MSIKQWALPALALSFVAAVSIAAGPAPSSQTLWEAFKKAPNLQPNLPDCSYAGYAAGEKPLPSPKVVADVKKSGAKGDNTTDDTAAFNAAIQTAGKAGGGAVLVPAGQYRLEGVVYLNQNNVVLRGEGQDKTILNFQKPLQEIHGRYNNGRSSAWSWCGGLIWMGPADVLDASGRLIRNESKPQDWEYWRQGAVLTKVTAPAVTGDSTITVDAGAKLKAGDIVLLTWDNLADNSLLNHIAGHANMAAFQWNTATWINNGGNPQYRWPVRIAAVAGNKITLKQPLRLDIKPQWNVRFEAIGPIVTDTGVEALRIVGKAPMGHKHLTNIGYNGVYINRVVDGFVRNVDVRSMENGINVASSKNVTVTDVVFTGPEQHHHTLACRVSSADILYQNFVNKEVTRVKHGINVEWFSSGNVWRQGVMAKGTLDSHRALSFDNIRTDLDIANDDGSNPGGDGAAGPYLGKRMVHWNIRVGPGARPVKGEFVNQPTAMPMGLLVGVQNAPLATSRPPAMPGTDVGCLCTEEGTVPAIKDLYQAQLDLRLKGK
ncbi:MAG: glycosyl hydrolase family 28-related protein [Phycisphaerae bacterium]